MKRFIIALALLAIAVGLAFYSDAKTEKICTALKSEFVQLNDIADKNNIDAMQSKAREISGMLDEYRKILYILSDHGCVAQIERNLEIALEETNAKEVKRYCGDSIAVCESIIDSCKPYIRNIF